MGPEQLFSGNFDSIVGQKFQAFKKDVDLININMILTRSDEALFEELFKFHGYVAPTLQEDKRYSPPIDQKRQGIAHYVIYVPFEGNRDLFHIKPRDLMTQPVRGVVNGGEVGFEYLLPDVRGRRFDEQAHTEAQSQELNRRFEADMVIVRKNLEFLAKDVQALRDGWFRYLRDTIGPRRGNYHIAKNVLQAAGYPLQRRADADRFEIPVQPQIILSTPPQSGNILEPRDLKSDEYEAILSTVMNMALVMERNPSSFVNIGEVPLRNFFLMILNAMYQGNATGETFNSNGKTDILIRENGQNVFIGECKIWDGPATLIEAVDQIVEYTTWRDTKTAIFLFNQNKKLSAVLKQIPGTVQAHPNYKHDGAASILETRFQYIFRHRNDPEKEFTLTILVFDVPTD